MLYNYNKNNVTYAKKLRKNMTKEEKHLWYDFLSKLPITVNRQKNIGNYIVDFFIASKRIAIEIDGKGHGESEQMQSDQKRDSELQNLGILVLRYSNTDVNQKFDWVCQDLLTHLELKMS